MKLINRMNKQLMNRRLVLLIFDLMSVWIASIAPLMFRFNLNYQEIPDIYLNAAWDFLWINIIMTLLIFYFFRLYHSLWAFAGITEAQNIVAACFLCAVLDYVGLKVFRYEIPRSYPFMYAMEKLVIL